MISMKKIIKWVGLIIFAGFFFTILSIAGGVHLINSSYGQNLLLERINTLIPGNLALSHLNFTPLNGSLELTNATLRDPDGMEVVGFDKFFFKIDWQSLLKKEIRISEILLQQPWGRLYVNSDGRLNLLESVVSGSEKKEPDEEKKSSSKALPFNIILDSLNLEDGNISFDYPSQNLYLDARGIHFRADGDLSSRLAHLNFELKDLDLRTQGMEIPSSRLNFTAKLQGVHIDLSDFSAHIGESDLNLSGHLADMIKLAGLDFQIRSTLSIEEIAKIFKLKGNWIGKVNLAANLTGDLQNPNMDLKIGLENGTIFNRILDRVDLAAELSDRNLTIEKALVASAKGKIELTAQADLKSAFAHGFLKPPVDLDRISYDIDVAQTAPDVGPWVPEVPGLRGALESRLTLSGKGTSFSGLTAKLNLSVKGNQLVATGIRNPMQGHFNLEATIDNRIFELQKLDGNIDGIKLDGAGNYNPEKKAVTAQLILDAEDLSQPLTLVGLASARGKVNLFLDLTGTLKQPKLNLILKSENLGYDKISIGTIDLAADLRPDGILQISSFKLDNRGSSVNGQVQLRFQEDWKGVDPTYDQKVSLTLKGIEVRNFYDQEIVQGSLNGKILLAGLLDNLKGTAELSARGVAAKAIRVGNLNTKIHLDGRTLKLEKLHLQNKSSELKGSGQILLLDDTFGKITADPQFKVSLSSAQILLEDFLDGIKGRLILDTRFDGTLKHPRGFVAINGQNIDTGVQKIFAVDLSAEVNDDRVDLNPLKITLSEDEDIIFTGWAQKDLSFGCELKSDGVDLSSVDAIKKLEGFQGGVKAYISGYGNLKDPSVDGSLLLQEIKINGQKFDDFRLHLSLHDHLVRAYGNLAFDLDGSYHLLKKEFAAQLNFYQTQLNPYFRIAGQPDLNGKIDGKVTVNGNIERPTDATVDLDLKDVILYLKKKKLLYAEKIRARMVKQHMRLEDTHISLLSQGDLTIKGDARLNGPIDVSLDARLPIADTADFSEMLVDSKGEVQLSAQVSGSLPRPQIKGELNIADIAFAIPANAQKIEKLNGTIMIDPEQIQIKKLDGKLDTGRFGLSGNIKHEFFTPQKMILNFYTDSLPVEIPDTLSLLLNSRIEIRGEGEDAAAKGKIVLVSGTYYKDVKIDLSLLENIGKRSRSVSPPAEPIKLPFLKKIDLKVAVSYREPFLVQNNLADMEIRPDLSLGGTLNLPVLSGRANVSDGTLTFKKKVFTINKGVIDFINPYKTEMSIDIESSTVIRDWTINLAVKGTPNNLEFRLSSIPADLSDADILSLLIFSKTSEEFSNGETKGKKSTNELLAGLIADTFSDELKGATGMDILELETGAENGANVPSDRVKVTVGKHLSDRMTFKVSMESENGETVSRYMPEYKILDNILVSGFQDTQGVYGGELVFRIEFR